MQRVTPSLVLSIIAIVLAGTAGASAATKLITGKQIKNSSLTGADIRNGSLTARDIRNGSISADELDTDLIDDIQAPGTPGPQGVPGPQGPAGPTGPAAVVTTTTVNGNRAVQGALGSGTEVQLSIATCPGGTVVTGGGFDAEGIENFVEYAKAGPTTYSVIAVNEFSQASAITAQAICVPTNRASAARARSRRVDPKLTELVASLQEQVDDRRHRSSTVRPATRRAPARR